MIKRNLVSCRFGILLFVTLLCGVIMSPYKGQANPFLPIVSEQGIISIEIHQSSHKLIVMMHKQPIKTYSIAVGKFSTPTPIGEYRVIYKGKNWGPAFGPRWLG